LPQKWPLKWVPISLPSSQAPAQLLHGVGDALLVVEADVGAARRVLRGPVQVALVLRQHVHAAQEVRHVALLALETLRKWENSRWLSSPAPSQEKTTNCGGF
jgi:hypothetical protein